MKNKFFFPLALATLSMELCLSAHDSTHTQAIEGISLSSAYSATIFEDLLTNCPPLETASFPLSLRHAHAVEDKTFLQKLHMLAVQCYTHILCRYYSMQKWLLRQKQSSKKIASS